MVNGAENGAFSREKTQDHFAISFGWDLQVLGEVFKIIPRQIVGFAIDRQAEVGFIGADEFGADEILDRSEAHIFFPLVIEDADFIEVQVAMTDEEGEDNGFQEVLYGKAGDMSDMPDFIAGFFQGGVMDAGFGENKPETFPVRFVGSAGVVISAEQQCEIALEIIFQGDQSMGRRRDIETVRNGHTEVLILG